MLTISTRTVSYTNGINIRCFFGMRNRFKWVNTNKWDEDKKEPQRTVASYVHFIHKYTHTLTPVFTYNYPLRIANMHTHTNTFTYSYGTAAHVCTCACVYTHASETELSIVSMEKWSEWELQRSHIECLLKYFRIRFVWNLDTCEVVQFSSGVHRRIYRERGKRSQTVFSSFREEGSAAEIPKKFIQSENPPNGKGEMEWKSSFLWYWSFDPSWKSISW